MSFFYAAQWQEMLGYKEGEISRIADRMVESSR
jgi:hypothetical protein